MPTLVEALTRQAVHKRDHDHPLDQSCSDPVECVSFGSTLWFAICHDCAEETPLTDHAHVLDYARSHHCTCS